MIERHAGMIGKRVAYVPYEGCQIEYGRVTALNDQSEHYVYVVFDGDHWSKMTPIRCLFLEEDVVDNRDQAQVH